MSGGCVGAGRGVVGSPWFLGPSDMGSCYGELM